MTKPKMVKVILNVPGFMNYDGKRYNKGDELSVTEHFFKTHASRFQTSDPIGDGLIKNVKPKQKVDIKKKVRESAKAEK